MKFNVAVSPFCVFFAHEPAFAQNHTTICAMIMRSVVYFQKHGRTVLWFKTVAVRQKNCPVTTLMRYIFCSLTHDIHV